MARHAVAMPLDQFEGLLITWMKNVIVTNDEELPYESQQEEDDDARDNSKLYVIDNYVRSSLMLLNSGDIFKDLQKVTFDWENSGCILNDYDPCGFWVTNTGIPTLGCYAGGDWEDPIYFVLYPETASTIRAYIPKNGNTWVIKTKYAWGNDDDAYEMDNPRKVDSLKFRTDVAARLILKP